MPTQTCAVCQTARKGMNRAGGLDVCDVCLGGGAGQAVSKRGWQLDTRAWQVRTRDATFYYVQSDGIMNGSLPFTAKFRMRRSYWIVMNWIFGVKTHDPLFNNLVYASSTNAAMTAKFLEDEGPQSAIMDLVGEYATITVSGNKVTSYVASTNDVPNESRVEAETAVLMAHVESFIAVHLS